MRGKSMEGRKEAWNGGRVEERNGGRKERKEKEFGQILFL